MQLNDIFPSKYVKAADLKGREVPVVISDVQIEQLGNDRKLVLYFQGAEKGLVTNRTNADRIGMLYGDDTDNWLGKEITLFTDFVTFQGKTVEAIRVRPPRRSAAPTPAPQQRQPQQQQPAPNDGFDTHQSGGATVLTKRPPQQQPKDGLEEVLPEERIPF